MPTIIAHLRQYPPHRWIGAELATHTLLKYLQSQGWDVLVRMGERLDEVPPNSTYEYDGVLVTNSWLHLITVTPDVVLHGSTHWTTAQAHARGAGALQVQWLHGGWESWQVVQIQGAQPDIVVFNNYGSQRATAPLISQPSTVLHPPVWPSDEMCGQIRTPLQGGKATLVNCGEGKGAELFYELAARMPQTEFLAVGGGHGQQIPVPAELTNVEFRPHGSDMAGVWRDTAVLLMPSSTESWGMVAVEAMHRGIPVIGSNIPGLSECLGWGTDPGAHPGMPLVNLEDGPGGWAAMLRMVLASWDHWSDRALERSEWLNPAAQLHEFEGRLRKELSVKRGEIKVN